MGFRNRKRSEIEQDPEELHALIQGNMSELDEAEDMVKEIKQAVVSIFDNMDDIEVIFENIEKGLIAGEEAEEELIDSQFKINKDVSLIQDDARYLLDRIMSMSLSYD